MLHNVACLCTLTMFFFLINEYSYFEKICICSAFDDKPQNFKENFILLWLIIVTSVKINTSGGGGDLENCIM